MAYHIGFIKDSGKIYAGTLTKNGKKWINKNDVTEEALIAVRNHFINLREHQEDKPAEIGYQWPLENGYALTLKLVISAPPAETKEEPKE